MSTKKIKISKKKVSLALKLWWESLVEWLDYRLSLKRIVKRWLEIEHIEVKQDVMSFRINEIENILMKEVRKQMPKVNIDKATPGYLGKLAVGRGKGWFGDSAAHAKAGRIGGLSRGKNRGASIYSAKLRKRVA